MIEQYATYRGEPTEEDKKKFNNYPNIHIKKHINPTGKKHIILFEHKEILTAKKLNVPDKWKIGENQRVSINPPKLYIKGNKE